MRHGFVIPPCTHMGRVADAVVAAEDHGFDTAWVLDAQLIWRDTWATLALAADRTSRIRLGTAVTTAGPRHSTVLASAANSVSEMAHERLVLGLGTGAGMGYLYNHPFSTRRELRHDIEQIRALMSGQTWDFGNGAEMGLIGAGGSVPIHIAAGGPKVAELAGEVADGVIFTGGWSPEHLAMKIAWLAPGLERSGRTLDDIEICVNTFFHLVEDPERDIGRIKTLVDMFMGADLDFHVERDNEVPDMSKVAPVYPSLSLSGDYEEAVRAAAFAISDDGMRTLAPTVAFFGTADEIAVQMKAAEDAGVNHLIVSSLDTQHLPFAEMEAYAKTVLAPVAGTHGRATVTGSG
jgi:5,10-methylenetetrahydromethanopterin reductase